MAKLWLDHRIWICKDQQIIGFMLWHDIIIIKYSDISIFQLQLNFILVGFFAGQG